MWTVLLVGLGQVGMQYDLYLDREKYTLTHASAFSKHSSFSLVGGIDSDSSRCQLFEKYYACAAFDTIEAALSTMQPDVVVIATPTQFHSSVLKKVLKHSKPTAILCEKPLSYHREEAQEMLSICSSKGCRLYTNYLRRSDPGVIEIKRRLARQLIQGPVKGVVWYSKGLIHNGSHFFDLMQNWLGKMQDFRLLSSGLDFCEHSEDCSPDIHIKFVQGDVFFLAAKEENFSHYTVNFVAQNGCLRYEQGGADIRWFPVIEDPCIKGYKILSADAEVIEHGMEHCQKHVADQLALSLMGQVSQICNGIEALSVLESLSLMREKCYEYS